MRVPTLDELVDMVAARWDTNNPDKLRDAVALVRDAVLLGSGRAHLRRQAADRKRNRSPRPRRPIRADVVVLRKVARAAGMDVAQLLAHDRSQAASAWRFRAMWVLRRARKRSLSEVSAVIPRTFSAIVNGVRRVDAEVARDPVLAAKLRRLAAS